MDEFYFAFIVHMKFCHGKLCHVPQFCGDGYQVMLKPKLTNSLKYDEELIMNYSINELFKITNISADSMPKSD